MAQITIHLPPDLERRLSAAAARRGQSLDEYARELLEASAFPGEPEAPASADLWAGLPRRSPDDLLVLAEEQGIAPAHRLEDLMGGWPPEDDVDQFLAERRQWQWQGPDCGKREE